MNNPFVSVVVAVRNGAKFIENALESIFAQSYSPLEVLVVDGDSTDETVAIASRFSDVKIIPLGGKGISKGYNAGIKQANGGFISFLSHDDIWTEGKLESQMQLMLNHPELLYVVGKVKFFLDDINFIPAGFRSELLEGDHVGYIPETILARKEVFEKVGYFDENLEISEDVDWFARAKDLEIASAVVPQVLLHKRIHQTNSHLTISNNNQILLQVIKNSIKRKRSKEIELI